MDGINLERSFNLVVHKSKFISTPIQTFLEICREYGEEEKEGY